MDEVISFAKPRPVSLEPKLPPYRGGTRWNGEPCIAKKVRVLVGDDQEAQSWVRQEGLVGKWIEAVEVVYGNQKFYLDDRQGEGWAKVTVGWGSPAFGHKQIMHVAEVAPRARIYEFRPRESQEKGKETRD